MPLLVTLLAMALQVYRLETKSLWHDEFATLVCAGWEGSWWDALRYPLTIPTTPKPPLSYLVTHLFLAVGDQAFLLRLPAVLFATMTVALVYTLGKSLFDRQRGLLGAFLLAIAPLQVRYAQEARMYALLSFLLVLSLYLLWQAVRSRQGRWWAGFATATILALYTHLFALLALGVMVLFALGLWVRSRGQARPSFRPGHFVLALTAIFLAYAPMVPFLFKGIGSGEGLGGEAEPGWDLGALLDGLRLFSGAHDLGLVVCIPLLVVAVVTLARKRRDLLALATLWIVLPVAAVLITPFGHAVRIRYFLFALPVYLLLIAHGLSVLSQSAAAGLDRLGRSLRLMSAVRALPAVALVGILAGANLVSLGAYYGETKQDWRGAVRLVCTLSKPGDKIFVRHRYHQAGVLYYARQSACGTTAWTEQDVQVFPDDLAAAFPPDGGHDSWLIVPLKDRFLPDGRFESWIQPHYRLLEPTVLPPYGVPWEGRILSPTMFRSMIVVPVVPIVPPSARFWADQNELAHGGCTWLRWAVEGVREVYLEGEGVVGHGERQVCPTAATRYTLEVIHLDGADEQHTVEIGVSTP